MYPSNGFPKYNVYNNCILQVNLYLDLHVMEEAPEKKKKFRHPDTKKMITWDEKANNEELKRTSVMRSLSKLCGHKKIQSVINQRQPPFTY